MKHSAFWVWIVDNKIREVKNQKPLKCGFGEEKIKWTDKITNKTKNYIAKKNCEYALHDNDVPGYL